MRKLNAIIISGVVLLMLIGFLVSFSTIQFPFLNAQASLNGHLKKDFGVTLPKSAAIEASYWVGSHDPENVFKIQIDPKDITPFIDSVRAAAKARNYAEQDTSYSSRFGPLYRTPPWWNTPALADGVKLEYEVPVMSAVQGNYRFLYSPSTGKLYLVWGTN